jgi:hypothetical protein
LWGTFMNQLDLHQRGTIPLAKRQMNTAFVATLILVGVCAGTLDYSFANVPPHVTDIVAAGLGTKVAEYFLDLSGYGVSGAVLFFLQSGGIDLGLPWKPSAVRDALRFTRQVSPQSNPTP